MALTDNDSVQILENYGGVGVYLYGAKGRLIDSMYFTSFRSDLPKPIESLVMVPRLY